jgi:broad-specificity NMP kinase
MSMGNYLITGRPGSGKTTVIHELQSRGITAHDTDAITGVTQLEDKASGEIIPWPDGPVDWDKCAWNWQEPALSKLLRDSETVFVGAIVGNQQKFYPLFSKIFILTLDVETLEKRLETHEHVRTVEEKSRIIANHFAKQQLLIEQGGIPILNSGPVGLVADEILRVASD